MNFFLEYCLTEYIQKELRSHKIDVSSVEAWMKQPSPSPEEKRSIEQYKSILNRFYVFNTFFYPKVCKMKRIRDPEEKNRSLQRLLKWSKEIRLFEREFVLIPVMTKSSFARLFTSSDHWSLATLCYPNYLYRYIKEKRTIFGINYNRAVRKTDAVAKGEGVENPESKSGERGCFVSVEGSVNPSPASW